MIAVAVVGAILAVVWLGVWSVRDAFRQTAREDTVNPAGPSSREPHTVRDVAAGRPHHPHRSGDEETWSALDDLQVERYPNGHTAG
jgi:hypothetical protein